MSEDWRDRQAAITRAECDVELRDFIDVKALADNPALPTNDCAAKTLIDMAAMKALEATIMLDAMETSRDMQEVDDD